jgi:hypothetical protein
MQALLARPPLLCLRGGGSRVGQPLSPSRTRSSQRHGRRRHPDLPMSPHSFNRSIPDVRKHHSLVIIVTHSIRVCWSAGAFVGTPALTEQGCGLVVARQETGSRMTTIGLRWATPLPCMSSIRCWEGFDLYRTFAFAAPAFMDQVVKPAGSMPRGVGSRLWSAGDPAMRDSEFGLLCESVADQLLLLLFRHELLAPGSCEWRPFDMGEAPRDPF